MKCAEAFVQRGLHFTGDVKTNTRRFCGDALAEATSEESGAWAVYTTKIRAQLDSEDELVQIYAVSHRRGAQEKTIHKFVSTCGTTIPGGSLKVACTNDEEYATHGDVDYEIARKCPKVLNDVTAAQPAIDVHNRYRQHELAMEQRIQTDRFSLRHGVSLHGILFTDAFKAYRYFKDPTADFKVVMNELAIALINNPDIQAPTPSKASKKNSRAASSSPCSSADGEAHELIPLRKIEGYTKVQHGQQQKWPQQRCMLCNKHTSWCCSTCTNGLSSLFPVCPAESNHRGTIGAHSCHATHCANPSFIPKGKGRGGGNKRRRTAQHDAEMEACAECDDDDSEESSDSE